MSRELEILSKVAAYAARRNDQRSYFVGAMGLRADGASVISCNGPATNKSAVIHAETRLSAKLDVGATVWVARSRRSDGALALAKPCPNCERVLRNRGVKKVFYSVSPNEYGVLNLQ